MGEEIVYTVGHSTHPQPQFIGLLVRHGITAVCDVRSRPYSRLNPQFNREEIRRALRQHGIQYVFLGEELGARSKDPACYENGKVQFGRLAQTDLFREGIKRIKNGMKQYRVALMCAEKEPLECHRTILVARHLAAVGIEIQHIHEDGRLETQTAAVSRLRQMLKLPENDLFRSNADVLNDAYCLQEARIAYETTAIAEAAADEPLVSRGRRMKVFTIGFTRKSAEAFFSRLRDAGVKRLVDVRLNNSSQLAGFTKRDDLRYFAQAICGIDYVHLPELAPTAEILDPYKKLKNGDWNLYEKQFVDLCCAPH